MRVETLWKRRHPRSSSVPAGRRRVIVLGLGTETSGIPTRWAATSERPGVNLLEDLSARSVARIAETVRSVKRSGDVHGHSSHHVRPLEVYQGKLILYGCGEFLDDYEGIPGYEEFRGDLVLMYFPTMDVGTGRLIDLRMVPLVIRNFRLNRASPADAMWLGEMLNRESRRFGVHVDLREPGLELWLRPG